MALDPTLEDCCRCGRADGDGDDTGPTVAHHFANPNNTPPSTCMHANRRDLQEQIQAERIKQALQRDDRVEARQRMAAGTLVSDPSLLASATHSARPTDSRAPLQQQPGHQHQQQQEQGEPLQQQQQQPGDAGDDWELEQLRQQRMQQLRVESARKQEQQREGLGVLNTVPESSVLVSAWRVFVADTLVHMHGGVVSVSLTQTTQLG